MNDVPFGLAFIRYSNLGMIMFVPLAKLFLVIARDRKSTRLNSSHSDLSRMPSSA